METEPAHRVVSLGVYADQLLLALADPSQIVSLSREATDPAVSYYSNLATGFPGNRGKAEAIIGLAPDLVMAGPKTPERLRDQITSLGIRIIDVAPVATIDEAIDQIGEIAVVLGRVMEGRDLARLIEAARRQATRTNWGLTVVSFREGGMVPGDGSLMSDLLGVIGLNNVGQSLSGGDGRVPLEVLVSAPPDYLVVPDYDALGAGVMAMLSHPAIDFLFPPASRIELPDRLTHCGGPSLPEALRRLASELNRVTP